MMRLLLFFGCLLVLNFPLKASAVTTGGSGGGSGGGGSDCIAGLPCVVPLTENDPDDDEDGPNADGSPNEAKSTTDACDADFMNQIYAKAFLEANRENIINEILVRKPDSVLEYTCFDQAMKDTADYAGPLFSESKRWQGATVPNPGAGSISINVYMGDKKLDGLLDDIIMKSLNEYADKNFEHDFLGGVMDGQNNTIASAVADAESTCSHMNDVFQFAKCNDFGLDAPFMSFEQFLDDDPRLLPEKCEGEMPITQELIDVANNAGYEYVSFDTVTTYVDLLFADSCEAPIPTGVKVFQTEFSVDTAGNVNQTSSEEFDDHVCPNPGCYFSDGSCVE